MQYLQGPTAGAAALAIRYRTVSSSVGGSDSSGLRSFFALAANFSTPVPRSRGFHSLPFQLRLSCVCPPLCEEGHPLGAGASTRNPTVPINAYVRKTLN